MMITKTILCYGDSNLRGYIPGSLNNDTLLHKRYPLNQRWPGILQNKLGNAFHIIEEGLAGRTVSFDEMDLTKSSRNGLKDLPLFLESHYPLDTIILSLGTNDVKAYFNCSVEQIAKRMELLIDFIQSSNKGISGESPKILLIAPPPLIQPTHPHPLFPVVFPYESIQKSIILPQYYKILAEKKRVEFLEASQIIKSSLLDGIHWEASQHHILAEKISQKISLMK